MPAAGTGLTPALAYNLTMTTSTPTSYRPGVQPGHDRFGQLVHAEWTKLRTVRGWVLGLAAAALVMVAFGLLPGMHGSCGQNGPASACSVPLGPGREPVSDSYYLVHQRLTGNGTRATMAGGPSRTRSPPRFSSSRRSTKLARRSFSRPSTSSVVSPWAFSSAVTRSAPSCAIA